MSRRRSEGLVELDPGAEVEEAQDADDGPATRLRSPASASATPHRSTRSSRSSRASSQPQPRSLVHETSPSPASKDAAAAPTAPTHSTPSAVATANGKGKGAARPPSSDKPRNAVAAGQAAPTWSRAAAAAAPASSASQKGGKKGKGKGKGGPPSSAAEAGAALSAPDPHAGICTTEYAYDNGVPVFPRGKRIPVVTPRFTRNAPLKSDGHPDLSSVADDVVRKKIPEVDLSDQRYDKRHQQFELSERKRKKWGGQTTAFDFHQEQRKRRDAEKQRLKDHQETASTAPAMDAVQEKGAPFSFWPDITKDHAKSIMVTDVLPVVAFGCGVPRFDRRIAFSLPQTGINAMILPKLKVEEVKTAAKPATDGPAASSGRRKIIAKKTYDPDKNGDFNDGVPEGILSEQGS